ncbi:MAG TPA: glutaredoxin domain-containing protein [Anaerolineae bacterium]|nr:glutaredoxin domain-containing protein [Anaerolineae bacterium]
MTQLFMYTRERTCGDQQLARLCLQEFGVPYTEINISREPDAALELQELIGCLAVPTLLIADEQRRPIAPPTPIGSYQSVRNVDRGSVISEPSREGLRQFLVKHALLQPTT